MYHQWWVHCVTRYLILTLTWHFFSVEMWTNLGTHTFPSRRHIDNVKLFLVIKVQSSKLDFICLDILYLLYHLLHRQYNNYFLIGYQDFEYMTHGYICLSANCRKICVQCFGAFEFISSRISKINGICNLNE